MMRKNMILGFAMLAFGAAAVLGGCDSATSGNGNGTCSASVSASCPATAPSYASDVAPLIRTYCGSCHAAGGQEADKPLDTYANLSGRIGEVQSQLVTCAMPPSGDSQPTAAELQTILDWITCGAQND
jgi:uncharacterized membrane protein